MPSRAARSPKRLPSPRVSMARELEFMGRTYARPRHPSSGARMNLCPFLIRSDEEYDRNEAYVPDRALPPGHERRARGGGGPRSDTRRAGRRRGRLAGRWHRAGDRRRGGRDAARGDERARGGGGRRGLPVDRLDQGAGRAAHARAHRPAGLDRPDRRGACDAGAARQGVPRRGAVEGTAVVPRGRRGEARVRRPNRGRTRRRAHLDGPPCRGLGAVLMAEVFTAVLILLVFMAVLAGASVRVLREYERAVVFRLGRLVGERGPGLVLLIPGIDRMVRVSLPTRTVGIPPQDVITRDNVTARVDAVAYFRVVDANSAVVSVEDAQKATLQIAQTTLRSVLGKADLDTLLSEREQLNEHLQQIIDEQTEPWGIKATTVEIKDVSIPAGMQKAMSRQAEAERERRARIINADAEYQAAAKLAEAAVVINGAPAGLQLRYMQTLREIAGGEQSSTIVFPLPIDLVKPLLEAVNSKEPAAPAELHNGVGVGELPKPQ